MIWIVWIFAKNPPHKLDCSRSMCTLSPQVHVVPLHKPSSDVLNTHFNQSKDKKLKLPCLCRHEHRPWGGGGSSLRPARLGSVPHHQQGRDGLRQPREGQPRRGAEDHREPGPGPPEARRPPRHQAVTASEQTGQRFCTRFRSATHNSKILCFSAETNRSRWMLWNLEHWFNHWASCAS